MRSVAFVGVLLAAACASSQQQSATPAVRPGAQASAVRSEIGRNLQRWVQDASGVHDWVASVGDYGECAVLSFADTRASLAPGRRGASPPRLRASPAVGTALEEAVERTIEAHSSNHTFVRHASIAATPTPACFQYEGGPLRGTVFLWVGEVDAGRTLVMLTLHEVR